MVIRSMTEQGQNQARISQVMREYLQAKLWGPIFGKNEKSYLDRTLGKEAEFGLIQIDPLGKPGDNRKLMKLVEESPRYEPLMMLGANGEDCVRGYYDTHTEFSFITEAGVPLVEILFPVFTDLVSMAISFSEFFKEFIGMARECDMLIIGTGLQPAIPDVSVLYDLWFPGMRYHLLRDLFLEKYRANPLGQEFSWLGKDFHNLHAQGVNVVTMTSSDQTHVEMHSPEEVILAYNVMQVVTPIFMALFRNAPVYGIDPENPQVIQRIDRAFISRELLWRAVNSGQSGFPGFYTEPADLVTAFATKQCYFKFVDDGYQPFDQPFWQLPDDEINDPTLAFVRGTDYSIFRLTDKGTGEFRPVCQQSPNKNASSMFEQLRPLMASSALYLGVILSLNHIWNEIKQQMITMVDVQDWYYKVQMHDCGGLLQNNTKFMKLMYIVVEAAYAELKKRQLGEQEFLSQFVGPCSRRELDQHIRRKHPHLEAYGEGGHQGFQNFLHSVAFGDTATLF